MADKSTFTGIQIKTSQGKPPVVTSNTPQWVKDAAGRR